MGVEWASVRLSVRLSTLSNMNISEISWLIVITLTPSFLIGSSLFLQVTRTSIKSRMGSKLGSIRRRTYELAALECLENPHRLIMGEKL